MIFCPRCPKCNSNKVERTCNTFTKGKRTKWTGWYCQDCGHWWEKKIQIKMPMKF